MGEEKAMLGRTLYVIEELYALFEGFGLKNVSQGTR